MRRIRAGLCLAGILLLAAGRAVAGDWQMDIVDRVGDGVYTSLKFDALGNAHLAYAVPDGNHYPLKYAFWDHELNRWFVMQVARSASFVSLALDSKGRPHISFADQGTVSGCKLRYAHWDGAAWKVEAVPLNSDIISYYTSIAMDPQDRPVISFYEYRGPRDSDIRTRLRIAKWQGEGWLVQTVDGERGSGKFNSVAVDSRGGIHIGYANVGVSLTNEITGSVGGASMRYAFWDGAWKMQTVEAPKRGGDDYVGYVGYSAALTLDSNGAPHVVYTDATRNIIKYAVRQDGRWRVQTVEAMAKAAYPDRNAIAVDDSGRPYIAYYDAGAGTLSVAYLDGKSWVIERIEANRSGFTPSIQVHDGTIWVSYADQANHVLKVARRPLPSKSPGVASTGPGASK